jgi:protocatechuate 3,4-dioxygenase beta subunit
MSEDYLQKNSRRHFVKGILGLAIALPSVTILGKFFGLDSGAVTRIFAQTNEGEGYGAMDVPPAPPSRITIPHAGEPGEPLIISGTVYKEDGKTPAPGILIYVYHTNAAGIYPKKTPDNGRPQWRAGYLRGWMKTDEKGRYEFSTIRPGGYPGGRDPRIFTLLSPVKIFKEYWIDSFWFDDDPRISNEMRKRKPERGGYNPIIRLVKGEKNVWRGSRNIRLESF